LCEETASSTVRCGETSLGLQTLASAGRFDRSEGMEGAAELLGGSRHSRSCKTTIYAGGEELTPWGVEPESTVTT